MLKMIEVVGKSDEGFSDAVRKAVEKMAENGERMHFFEVQEQRGAIRDGKIGEYQVKVKIAVE